MSVNQREERSVIFARLIKLQGNQLQELSVLVGISLHVGLSREESVNVILKAMGYPSRPLNTREEVAPVEAPVYTMEEVRHLLDTYVQDEIALLRATASMLETLHNLGHPTKQYVKEVRAEMGRQAASTNIPRVVTLMRMLFPDSQL